METKALERQIWLRSHLTSLEIPQITITFKIGKDTYMTRIFDIIALCSERRKDFSPKEKVLTSK